MADRSTDKLSLMAEGVRSAYKAGQEDEQLEPLVRVNEKGEPVGSIKDGDFVIFYDIRGEREVQITRCFTEDGFSEFPVRDMKVGFSTMIEYDPGLDVEVAFPPPGAVEGAFGQVVSSAGMKQVKVCESEKAVHVGFFLNGKAGEPFENERRVVIESPRDVDTFDKKPEMAADQMVAAAITEIRNSENDLVFVNFPNVDVVGHIENREAIHEAVRVVDRSVSETVAAALDEGMTVIVTADHGTVEKWYYPDGAVDTGHTDSPVPFIVAAPGLDKTSFSLSSGGSLIDVAPTAISILGLDPSPGMTGKSLIENDGTGYFDKRDERRRLLLIIADGWGYNESADGNLLAEAGTPGMQRLFNSYPSTILAAAGEEVGMPKGTVGNSEAGHMHIGAGRVVYSDRMRIDRAIEDGSYLKNSAFLSKMHGARDAGAALHLYGIVSFYSSHGSVSHLEALIDAARAEGVKEVYIHSLLGRRGERPESGALYIDQVERKCAETGIGKLVTVVGRFWALDREHNWDRIEKAYRAMVYGEGTPVPEA